jgi:uncharacterized protein (TIGR02996 family)
MSQPAPLSPPTDLLALLRAVEDGPGDMETLQVLADWFEENDQPLRAELIHLHLDLAALPEDEPGKAQASERQEDLRARFEQEWLAPLCGGPVQCVYDRGTLAGIALDVQLFLAHAEEICLQTGARHIDLFSPPRYLGGERGLGALASSPYLARVRSLDLAGAYLTTGDIEELTSSPYLTGMTELRLQGNSFGVEGVRALAGCRSLVRLSKLRLGGNLLGDSGARLLAEDGLWPNLTELDLSRNSVTDGGLAALAASPLLGRLGVLDLSENVIGDVGVRVLVRSPYLGNLHALDLGGNFFGDGGLAALANCRRLRGLRGLDVHGNYFGAAGVAAWARSPFIGQLLDERFRHLR